MKRFLQAIKKLLLLPFLIIGVSSCSQKESSNYSFDAVESEVYEYEHSYFDTFEDEILFYDQIVQEILDSEKIIDDLVEYEFYLTDEVLKEDYSESLYASLPDGFENYDIDWEGVLAKYAIGTTIIVFSGIVTVSTLKTPVAFIFATAFKEGLKEALIGGTIGGIINAATKSIEEGTFDWKAVQKYFIEGFADGYMWGAISGTIMGIVKGAVLVTTPKTYYNSDYTTLLGKGDDAANFYDSTGKFLGKVREGTNGNTYIVDPNGKVLYMFDENNMSSQIVNSYRTGITAIKAPSGRYPGGNFTVDGKKVYKGGKLVGELNEVGDIIGVNEYSGMLLGTIDSAEHSTANYLRAINGGINLDCYGHITNVFVENTNPETVIGGAQSFGSYVLNNGKKANVIYDGSKYYLMDSSNKILALLDDSFNIQTGWNKTIAELANYGVRTNKQMIIKMIQDDVPFDYGPSFTDYVIDYIKTHPPGKFPPELRFQGHHINSVAQFPWLANDPNNIQFYDYEMHKAVHNGKWSNLTQGELRNIVEVFMSIFGGL